MSEATIHSSFQRYFIVFNIAKKNNVVSLLLTAIQFNFVPIFIGSSKLVDSLTLNNQPLTSIYNQDKVIIMDKISSLKIFLADKNIPLIGIEISNSARWLNANPPFTDSIALMPGNEGDGMSESLLAMCDGLVCIPQYGCGIESLNVCVAASIVLYEYFAWSAKNSVSTTHTHALNE